MRENTAGKRYAGWSPVLAAGLIILLLAAGRDTLYPVRVIIWHADALAWWFVIIVGSAGQGTLLFKGIFGDSTELSPSFALGIVLSLGLGLFSFEVLVLGASGFMNPPSLTLLALAVLFLTLTVGRSALAAILARAAGELSERDSRTAVPLTAITAAALMVLPFVLLPSRSFDALSYHLEVPARYLQAGGIINIPENLYSYTPLLTQMLYGMGMGLSGADLAGLLYYTFFILTIWTIWRGGKELFGAAGAVWAAALMALTPVFLIEVPQPGADWSMTLFILSALLLVGIGGRNTRIMVAAGILAGLAAACRHHGLGYGLVLIPLACLVADIGSKRIGILRSWSIFMASALLSAFPWYIKNLVQTGDPLYPLLASLAGKIKYEVGFVDGLVGLKPFHLLWSWIMVPFQSAFDPLSLSMTATIGVLPIVLVFLLPGLKDRHTGSYSLLVWMVLGFLAWHVTFRTFRYAMPVVAVAYLWLGAALAKTLEAAGTRERILKYSVCLALAVNGAVFVGLTGYANNNVAPALGIVSPELYIRGTYRPYQAIEYLNDLDSPPGGVLFVGEMRGFYSLFPREVPSHNAPNRFFELISKRESGDAIAGKLHEKGFTHILFNPSEWERMAYKNRNAPLWRLDAEERARVRSFLENHTRLLFEAEGVSVHRIRYGQG